MAEVIEGTMNASGLKVGIVVTRWNEFVTERLLEGATSCLRMLGGNPEDITVVRCPGAFEVPLVLKEMAVSGAYDALVTLGAVIRGATPHFDYVAGQATSGIAQIAMETGVPCGFGILTVDTIEQAIERAGTKAGNKGWEAAQTAVETATLLKKVRSEK